jgi:hypothetical protein
MMGKRMPETYWALFERRAIKLRDRCIWLVDLFECNFKQFHYLQHDIYKFLYI